MRNFNAQNKVNNAKGSKRTAPMIIAAIAALAGAAIMLTGCGSDVPASSLPASDAAVTTSASSTSEATTATEAAKSENKASSTSTVKAEENASETTAVKATSPASTATADNIGVDEATAIANVKALAGSGATIISSTKGTAPDTGFVCWVVVVAPVTNGNGPETVTYYSGYQFCYTFENSADSNSTASDGQNPMMNFIGTYTNGRAMMTITCIGSDQAAAHISWGSSAFETSVWDMSGEVQCGNEGVSIKYDNCTKQTFKYSEDGQLLSDDIEYTNGSGYVEFLAADNNGYWYDAVESAGAGEVFTFCG